MFKRSIVTSFVSVVLLATLLIATTAVSVFAEDSDAPVLASVGVDKSPSIDGKDSDKQWQSATWLETDSFRIKSVYANDVISFLIAVDDSSLNIAGPESWIRQNNGWAKLGSAVTPDAVSITWDSDTWNLLSGASDQAASWILGGKSAQQNKSVSPAKGDAGPSAQAKGTVTFVGWAEDTGDSGTPGYTTNANSQGTAPLYIKKKPSNWADAMVISQQDINSKKAVKVSDLSAADLTKAWEAYQKFNAVVPAAVLTTPARSCADIEAAAVWADGTWTIEISRKLDTGNADDLQFKDMMVDYPFILSVGSVDTQAVLRFDAALKGLAGETNEEESEGGCYCRTSL